MVYQVPDGTPRIESFPGYSYVDVEIAVQAIATRGWPIAHPLFFAMEPSLFWPTILYFGSISNAFARICGSVRWLVGLLACWLVGFSVGC